MMKQLVGKLRTDCEPMKKMMKRLAVVAVLIALVFAIGGMAVWYVSRKSLPKDQVLQKIWWRASLYTRKATGGVPDLTWSELWQMTRREGGFGLERVVSWGTSLDGAIGNPYLTDEDKETGERIFIQRCTVCHGGKGAGGGIGPALNHSGFKHGESDLAIYKVLRDGVQGTPMVAPPVSFMERWQLVGYVKSLMVHAADRAARPQLHINVSSEQLLSAGSKTDEWLTYSGSFDGRRYTPLAQINASNIAKLRIRWVQQFDNNESDPIIEATPLVVGGVIFTTLPASTAVALDATTGKEIWRYNRAVSASVITCCGRYNRGMAILGHTLFLNTLDAHVVALDANTGKVLWETVMADNTDGYSMTGAPLIAGQTVVVGIAGGDLGIRGFLAGLDPATGRELWRFHTVPGPGEPGHETWTGDAWKTGGGPTWAPGSYDAALDLVYWGVGNPAPDYSGDTRGGDNLYSNSVIALHPQTGKLEWYFQFTPHDEHDWDSTQTPMLAELVIDGVKRQVICWANRNGFYYVLDRVTGKFLTAAAFVEQNWATGFDPKGRPLLVPESSTSGRLTKPAFSGGTNWQNAALDTKRGLVFIHATEGASVFTKSLVVVPRDPNDHSKPFLSSGASSPEPPTIVVRALDAATGARKWEHIPGHLDQPHYGGLLATGAGLVFGAEGGDAFALDSDTGHEVWRVSLGGATQAAPISFTVDGKQVIEFSIGRAMFLFGL